MVNPPPQDQIPLTHAVELLAFFQLRSWLTYLRRRVCWKVRGPKFETRLEQLKLRGAYLQQLARRLTWSINTATLVDGAFRKIQHH